jgi:hypothetical protein
MMITYPEWRVYRRVLFWAALSLSAMPIAAAQAECDAIPAAPSITLDIQTPPVRYKLSEATETLSARARENGTALGRGSRLLGLTVNQYDLQIVVTLDRERVAGDSCATLRNASITASPDLEVLADGRFKARSCQQRAIVDHENEHVAVFREAIAYYEPAMEDALRQARLPSALLVAGDSDPERDYAAMIRGVLAPVLDAVRRRTQEANDRIDTAEHYAAVFRRCSSWE